MHLPAALSELQPFVHAVVLAVAALLPIVDPIGSVPLYLQATAGLPVSHRPAMAKAVAFDSFLLLLASALVGAYVLDFFGLSIPSVQVAGGLIVCIMGWKLLNAPDGSQRPSANDIAVEDLPARAFYPLAMPLTVGPGSISVAITLGANPRDDVRTMLETTVGHVVGILIVAAAVHLCYRYADVIVRRLGSTGRAVLMRLSAFIVICIGVQIMWNGVHGLVVSAYPHLA
jgi:multiple antibiotic resistance protein